MNGFLSTVCHNYLPSISTMNSFINRCLHEAQVIATTHPLKGIVSNLYSFRLKWGCALEASDFNFMPTSSQASLLWPSF